MSRVFNLQMQQLKKDLLKHGLLGVAIAYVYTIEFQKHGLPHAHMLIFLHDDDKPRSPEIVNNLVCAEMPDPILKLDLHQKVKRHMIHGPCGQLNPQSPCMDNGMCSRSFPKKGTREGLMNIDGYQQYKCRQ